MACTVWRALWSTPRISVMSSSHTLRLAVSRLLIGVLLFAQLAVAGYGCPGLKVMGPASHGGTATAAQAAVASAAAVLPSMAPGCDQMDPAAPNLCVQHCHQGQHSADTANVPVVSPGIPTFLYSLQFEPQRSLGSGRSFPAPDARLDGAPEPPHAILHCVFRI